VPNVHLWGHREHLFERGDERPITRHALQVLLAQVHRAVARARLPVVRAPRCAARRHAGRRRRRRPQRRRRRKRRRRRRYAGRWRRRRPHGQCDIHAHALHVKFLDRIVRVEVFKSRALALLVRRPVVPNVHLCGYRDHLLERGNERAFTRLAVQVLLAQVHRAVARARLPVVRAPRGAARREGGQQRHIARVGRK